MSDKRPDHLEKPGHYRSCSRCHWVERAYTLGGTRAARACVQAVTRMFLTPSRALKRTSISRYVEPPRLECTNSGGELVSVYNTKHGLPRLDAFENDDYEEGRAPRLFDPKPVPSATAAPVPHSLTICQRFASDRRPDTLMGVRPARPMLSRNAAARPAPIQDPTPHGRAATGQARRPGCAGSPRG